MPSNKADTLKLLLGLFEQAEVKIKNVEQTTQEGLLTPSINQLRYAGYHIVRSLLEYDEQQVQEERVSAINHVKRAIYDIDEDIKAKRRFFITIVMAVLAIVVAIALALK
jgi:hypothetical protein